MLLGKRQFGSIMLFALVIIALLAGLSLLSMKNTTHASKLTQGFANYQLAFVRAEIALKMAEKSLQHHALLSRNNQGVMAMPGIYLQLNAPLSSTSNRAKDREKWLDEKYMVLQFDDINSRSTNAVSSYFVEKLLLESLDLKTQYFRVTARGVDKAGVNTVILQTIIRFNDQITRISWLQLQ